MAGGYSSDDLYEENKSKQTRIGKKQSKNCDSKLSPTTFAMVKTAKDKNSTDEKLFNIPEVLCGCQQKCTERVTQPLIQKVCTFFRGLVSRERQYDYLSTLIQIRVRHFNAVEKAIKGKPLRKMSFRYFIPIVRAEDVEQTGITDGKGVLGTGKHFLEGKISSYNFTNGDVMSGILGFPDWDHMEVCLRAFTTIHSISEKRVTITRAIRKLQIEVKCSKPFNGHVASTTNVNNNDLLVPTKKKSKLQEPATKQNNFKKISEQDDVSRLAAEWLVQQAMSAQKLAFAINPKTLLPEGLVLPASVTCLPMFSSQAVVLPTDAKERNRDLDLVDSFFSDQLWKPEYIGWVP